jgi:glycosyltransferase 2 family protein
MNDSNQQKIVTSTGKKRNILWYLINAVVVLVCIGILGRLVLQNLDTLSEIRMNLRIWPLLLTFPMFCIAEVMSSFAWGMVMNKIATPLSMSQHFKAFIVTFVGRRIPGGVWQYVGRIAWYDRLGVSKLMTVFGSVLETLLLIWSGLIMTLSLVFFLPGSAQKHVPLFIAGIILISTLMHPRIVGYVLQRMGQGERAKELNWRRILYWLLLYLPQWLVGGTILFLVLNSVYTVPLKFWPLCLGAYSLAGVVGMLVLVLPSGFGLNEVTTVFILSTNIPALVCVAGAILVRVLMTLYEFALAGFVFILYGRKVFSDTLPDQPEPFLKKNNKN